MWIKGFQVFQVGVAHQPDNITVISDICESVKLIINGVIHIFTV